MKGTVITGLGLLSFATSLNVLNIHVMVLYTSQGIAANFSHIRELAPIWESHINSKSKWPFNITVETYETASDCELISSIMKTRLNDTTRAPITAIVAEGDECGTGSLSSTIAAQHNIPIILTNYNPDSITRNFRMPFSQNTSFLINGATFMIYRQLTASYLSAGVKTIVAVASSRSSKFDEHSCFGAADWLGTRGAKVVGKFIIGSNDSTPRVIEIVNLIKQLNPDAVLWCDRAACQSPEAAAEFLPLQIFKNANYMPKALSLINCLSSEVIKLEDRCEYP